MRTLSKLVTVLSLLSLALSILVNIGLGVAIFYIVRIVKYIKMITTLKTTGTPVMATVIRFDNIINHIGSAKPIRVADQGTCFLVATWQHPETGKTYTFKTPIATREKFPIGSSVSFLVDYNNPRIHCLEDTLNAFTSTKDVEISE